MIAGLEILNLHAQGGMAEVYRARGKGADGHTWHYAVKRILPELTSDAELRKMFVEEARVASMLVHPNIVRVYDLAKSEADELYIVMEFLEGRDLAEAIDRMIDMGRTLPVWLAIHVAREVLQALIYATTQAVDREGRALALIHRDISPHNIFVCFDGQVKLTDFGVAKVAQSSVLTQVGVTKGKFGYMSPEQLMSERLDFRSDLYNVGILLYETLTCRRLFFGENASQFLQAMLRGDVPALDPALRIPPELENLMRRALSKERESRPVNAMAFEAELMVIAQRYGLTATREHVANELRTVFGSEIESCPVPQPARQATAPKQLASISAALPEAVRRVPSKITPLQQSTRGLSEPEIQVEVEAERTTSPDPIPMLQPLRVKTKTNTKSVRPIHDDPATIPPDDPSTIPPESASPNSQKTRRPTVVVGGAGAKAIGLRVDDNDDWGDRTTAEQQQSAPLQSRGGIVTRSHRVVPLSPKKK